MEQAAKPAEAPKPKSRTVLYAIVIVILIVVGVGVYYLTIGSTGTPPTVTIEDDGACALNASACKFSPSSVNATVNGAAINWGNKGRVVHTVTSCDSSNSPTITACPTMDASGLDTFNSGNMAASTGSFSHTFTKAGTYYYYCAIHPWMHATASAK